MKDEILIDEKDTIKIPFKMHNGKPFMAQHQIVIGRDAFFDLLSEHNLLVRTKQCMKCPVKEECSKAKYGKGIQRSE